MAIRQSQQPGRQSDLRACLQVIASCAFLWLPGSATAFELEMGQVTVQDTFAVANWTNVTFSRPFSVRPIVTVLPTTNGGDPMTLRIRNVTAIGFEVIQTEPSGNDGQHLENATAYLAIEPGNHLLPDGNRIVALEHTTTSFANRLISTTWDSVAFPAAFAGTPAIVAQIQTTASEVNSLPTNPSVPFMDVGIRNVTNSTFQVTLERAESTAGSVTFGERIGIVAIQNGTNLSFTDSFSNSVQLQALLSAANIRGYGDGCFTNSYAVTFSTTPIVVASANSRAGNNGGWVRRCSESAATLGLTIDEDIDTDAERNHTSESAGIIAASVAFHANFDVDLLVSKNVTTASDPLNGSSNPKSIPGADMLYTIAVANRGSTSPDLDTVTITDDLPAALRMCVTTDCLAGGPIVFDDTGSPVTTGITLGAVEYSNNNGASFAYTPIPDPDGFDAAVNAVRITLNGVLASIAPAGAPAFELRLTARVN